MLFIKKEGNRVILGMAIIALSVFGFLSYSKMFIVSYIALIAVLLLWIIKQSHKKVIALFATMLMGGMALIYVKNSGYISIMISRFLGGDVSTGRFNIWRNYLDYILNSPITLVFGDGLGSKHLADVAPHNSIIETVYFLGLLGGMIFLVAIFSVFATRRIKIRRTLVNYSLPLLFGFMCLLLGCLTINDLMFYCMLMWIGLNMDMNRKHIKNIKAG